MTRRATVYARVSSDEQRGNSSIPTQIEGCFQYIEAQGYSVVGNQFVDPETGRDVPPKSGGISAFVDDASGTTLERPSLDALRDFVDRVGVDVIVVYAIDRLSRDTYDLETLIRSLDQRGVDVEFVRGGKFDNTPIGRFSRHAMAFVGEQENWNRIDRSRRGKRAKAHKGRFVAGRPPYGYRLDETAKAGLVVVEKEAEIVRQIFTLYGREGLSIRGIAERLSTDGIPSPTGRPTWGKSSISNILRNETYVGKNHYNKHKRNGMKLAKRPRDEWIPIETTLIVDTLLFAEVQEKLRRNKDVRRQQPRRFYMLGGMVFCPDCGRVYTSQTQPAGKHRRKNDAQSYRHRAKEGHCRNRMISARKVDPIVWDRIVEVLLKPDNLREGYEESFELQQATTKRYGRRLQTLKRSRVKLDQKRKNLMDVYLDPDIQMTKPEFLHQQAAIDNELGTLEREIKSIEEDLAEVEIPPEYETIEAFADEIRDQLEGEDELTPREKRKILELLNIRVYIPEDGNLWLEGWFQSPSER